MRFLRNLVIGILFLFLVSPTVLAKNTPSQWNIQSIDTMKFSRDLAREKANDPHFQNVIDQTISQIKNTGATHVAIGTPYDEEFIPFLRRWVEAARKHNMKIWFRGNFSGWEGWFGYPKISSKTHTDKVREFILNNPDLFQDGDIFSSCPECENGGPGDPRNTKDVKEYQEFLINEYEISRRAFFEINKDVDPGYFSMNGDVAKIIMDKDTTSALGGLVVIDHYVQSAQQLNQDIDTLAKISGGEVILGEFGVPIPDIHGIISEDDQNKWLTEALQYLSLNKSVKGLNYWTARGGSTKLWNDDGSARTAVQTLKKFYTQQVIKGIIKNEKGEPIEGVQVIALGKTITSNKKGEYYLPYLPKGAEVLFQSNGYQEKKARYDGESQFSTTLVKEKPILNIEFVKVIIDLLRLIF